MRKWTIVAAAVAVCACTRSEPTLSQPPEAYVSRQTTLMVVNLFPEGTATIDAVSPRRIWFRDRGRRVPYDEKLHGMRVGRKKASRAFSRRDSTVSEEDEPRVPSAPSRSAAAVVIRHAKLQTPMVLPIDLGQPGEGGGDVADRWQHGSVILRVPFPGDGTHYTLVRPGRTALAEREVWQGKKRP